MLFLLISLVIAVVQQCPLPNELCIYGGRRGNNVIITVHSSTTGWVAFGTGVGMSNSQMVVVWRGPSGVIVSDRQSRARTLPTPIETVSRLVPLQVPPPPWARLSFSIERPVSGVMQFTPTMNFIYAMAGQVPRAPTDRSSPFGIHSKFGSFGQLDFTRELAVSSAVPSPSVAPAVASVTTTAATTTTSTETLTATPEPSATTSAILALPTGTGYDTVLQIHAYAMIFSLLVCPIAGIFVARFLKEASLWLRIHVLIMAVGFVGMLLGILTIVLFKNGGHVQLGPNSNPHHFIGISIVVLLITQGIMGICSHKFYSKKKTTTYDRIHRYLGQFVFLAILTNIYFGLTYYQSLYSFNLAIAITAGLIVAIGFGCFVYGEIKFGYTSRQDQEPAMIITRPDRYY